MSPRLGGQDRLSVVVKGNKELVDALVSRADGGSVLQEGLADLVRGKHGVQVDLTIEARGGYPDLLSELESGRSRAIADRPDLVFLGPHPDVLVGASHPDGFLGAMERVVKRFKDDEIYVVFLNASTIDPTVTISNYHDQPDPFTRRAQQVDLALLQLSIREGVSIIDADRILAEMGAADHVAGPLEYSAAANAALAAEALRILEDYGFFERRPLLVQSGSRDGAE